VVIARANVQIVATANKPANFGCLTRIEVARALLPRAGRVVFGFRPDPLPQLSSELGDCEDEGGQRRQYGSSPRQKDALVHDNPLPGPAANRGSEADLRCKGSRGRQKSESRVAIWAE
jgi:hypothetical protein